MAATNRTDTPSVPIVQNDKVPDKILTKEVQSSSTSNNATIDGGTNPVKTPFIYPSSTSSPAAPRIYSPDQEAKLASLLSTLQSWKDIPTSTKTNAPKKPLADSERMWLTRECILRYLRASKWNESQTTIRIMNTLVWRRDYGVESQTADSMSEENETGKQFILGYDNEGRPCLYLTPHLQNTNNSDKQIQHLVFMLERGIELMPPGQESLTLFCNFKDSRKGKTASVTQGRQTLSILQNHYPERLGRGCVKDLPWLIWGFFKLINPFIDPVTREKMKFDEDLRELVPSEQLIKAYGGDVDFEYDHAAYWPAFIGLAKSRSKEMVERWERAGRKVGESERYLRGDGNSVGEEEVKKINVNA